MKDNTVKQIADKLKISKTTVSKAMRHCSGVDSETRYAILKESREMNYHSDETCAIYVILPDIPQCFWKELKKGIIAGEQAEIAPIKYNVYTKSRDELAVLEYLNEAEHLNARAIIIAAHITPVIHQRLSALARERLVILLSEYHKLTNCFFIGGDAYKDGYTMGKEYLSKYTDRKLVLLSVQDNINVQKRLSGFKHAVCEEQSQLIEQALCIELDRNIIKNTKLFPSKLAPLLADAAKANDSLCVYSPVGLPQLSLVLIKTKLIEKTICLCHDYYAEKQWNETVIPCNQDVYGQGLLAAKVATDYVQNDTYPEQKRIYIPSLL